MAEKKAKSAGKAKPRKRRWLRWLGYLSVLAFLGASAAFIGLAVLVQRWGKDLPDISWAENYRPPIVSEVVSGDDQLLAEYYNERRRVVPYDRIPKKMVQALIAAEDANFFDHSGIDFKGVLRATIQNILSGRKKSGASTLTQQTAKAILITNWGFKRATAKTYHRKFAEALLARRLEQRFTKEQILYLYMNQVYLGHSSYGVEAAAENYFRKNIQDLTLGEVSLLAGLPQSPTRYSPFAHPEAAKARRNYVLGRMLDDGMITQAEHDTAAAEPVKVYPVEDFMRETAPYVSEHVRRDIVARYGNERLLNDGLKIYSTVDLDLERDATAAMLKGLTEVDKRQGYQGPLMHLDPHTQARPGTTTFNRALSHLTHKFRYVERKKGAAPRRADEMKDDRTYVGVVLEVSKEGAKVGVGDRITGWLPLDEMRWARKPNPDVNYKYFPGIDSVAKVLTIGDVILVRPLRDSDRAKLKKGKQDLSGPVFSLEQEPSLQGALVSMDPKSGYILAMIGGYDYNKSEFNRAFQACRQPGSSFKPIVYTAAMEQLKYTPSTILLDAPIVYDDPKNQFRWKPSDFEGEFLGDVTLRDALAHSMNIPAIRTLEAVGASKVAAWAHKLGITTPVSQDMSIALGSSCVTLWDLTHVYALINQGGKRVTSTFIRRVVDRDGHVLEDHSSYYDPWTTLHSRIAAGYAALFDHREQVMNPDVAFVMTHLLQEVCQRGTAAAASAMRRVVAGKTGTTNDDFDAWFMGYSPDIVTGVWVGFDTYDHPMDRNETGGHAALPIWMDYMSAALKGRPDRPFSEPPGVVFVSIDPKTGLRVKSGGVREAFVKGTEPPFNDPNKPPSSGDFMRGTDL